MSCFMDCVYFLKKKRERERREREREEREKREREREREEKRRDCLWKHALRYVLSHAPSIRYSLCFCLLFCLFGFCCFFWLLFLQFNPLFFPFSCDQNLNISPLGGFGLVLCYVLCYVLVLCLLMCCVVLNKCLRVMCKPFLFVSAS